MASELAFCLHLVDKYLGLWLKGRADFVGPFREAVNEVQDNAPGYYAIISEPMDLATMRNKLLSGLYTDAQAFKADFNTMINNCHTYNHERDPEFVKQYADRFVKELDWDWKDMGRWMSTKRRELARQAAAPAPSAPAAAPITGTFGTQSASSLGASASTAEPERPSRGSPSAPLGSAQGNGMATAKPSASTSASTSKRRRRNAEEVAADGEALQRAPINSSSEDTVGRAVRALRQVMVQHMDIVGGEMMARMEAQGGGAWTLWEKIWGPERSETSTVMWREKCSSQITREGWPTSPTAIKDLVEQAWSETSNEQIELLNQEEAAVAAAASIRKAAQQAAFWRVLK